MSHITVSTGRGDTLSTSDRISPIIDKETQAQHSYAKSSFWWLPAIR